LFSFLPRFCLAALFAGSSQSWAFTSQPKPLEIVRGLQVWIIVGPIAPTVAAEYLLTLVFRSQNDLEQETHATEYQKTEGYG